MKKGNIMKKLLLTLIASSLIGSAYAATETFDTSTDVSNLLNVDVFTGDNGTHWNNNASNAKDGGFILLNSYGTSNSIQLKDSSNKIESFQFWEYSYESSTNNNWTWSFYDSSNSLLGTKAYTNTGDSSLQSMSLLSLGYNNVATVQLSHLNGWMNLDNLTYSAVSNVPVPAALFMFAPALLGFMGLRRKAKNSVA